MDSDTLVSNLRGGYVERHTVDLGAKMFNMYVSVLENGKLSTYDVLFRSVSYFSFVDNQAGDWDRLELTDLWVDALPATSSTEEWEVSMTFWDLAQVKLRCSGISVDGAAVLSTPE